MNIPHEEQMKSAIRSDVDEVNPTSGTTMSLLQSTQFNEWLIVLASILFIIFVVVIVLRCRRQRQNGLVRSNRAHGIRKGLNIGQNDGDDEDDLLIGSLYS